MKNRFVSWNPLGKGGPGWIEAESGCDIWTGARTQNGYPTGGDGNGGVGGVHRIRYEREIGPIPDGMDLDHYVCNNGAGGCCNPHHCRPVTRRENILRSDSIASKVRSRTHCPLGHPLSGDNLVKCDFEKRGHRRCKACAQARVRRYRTENSEDISERRRLALIERREEVNAKRRERTRNMSPERREAERAYQRAYYAKQRRKEKSG